MIHAKLWENIDSIEFDSLAVGKKFSEHLASENGWTNSFAQRAIREYKRFLYLSVVSSQKPVPSDVVEQVWRLHLTDTRHYWGTLCKILGKQLHHEPVGANSADNPKSLERYGYTLKLYKEEFQVNPRAEFWPSSEDKNALSPKMERIDRNKYLVLQKPTAALWRSVGRFSGIATFPLSVVAYAVNQSSSISTGDISPLGWIMVASVAVVIAVFGCLVWRMEATAKVHIDEMNEENDLQDIKPRFA